MMHNRYLVTSKAMSHKMISKVIEHYSLYINDDVQAIIAEMVQGWIKEVNNFFGRASHMERLGESYTQYTVLCETNLYSS